MLIPLDSDIVRAIFKHSTSVRERNIARQVDNAYGRDKQRIISENQSTWAYWKRKAEEDRKKRGY